MAKKTDQERLQEIEEQMEKIKARKQQVESRMKEKERKIRTKRLIETGAIYESYFETESKEDAEKMALYLQGMALKNKEKVLSKSLEEVKQLVEQTKNEKTEA